MWLRRETAELPFAELKLAHLRLPAIPAARRHGAGTEMAMVIACNLKQALRALRPAGLMAALANLSRK